MQPNKASRLRGFFFFHKNNCCEAARKGGRNFAALPQRQNRFYTVFVRFGLILPLKTLFSKKVINTRHFAAKSFVYRDFAYHFPCLFRYVE